MPLADRLVDRCALVEPGALTGTVDTAGVAERNPDTVYPDVPCRVSYSTGPQFIDGEEVTVDQGKVMLPAYTDVERTWRFRYGGIDHRIVRVSRPVNYAGVEDHVLLVVERTPYADA